MTLLYTHDSARRHVTPAGHPEQVARYDAVLDALADLDLDRRDAPMADDTQILRSHSPEYLSRIQASVPAQGMAQLDGDTYLSPGSLTAALHAAGGAVAAVDAVLSGDERTAFVAMRPPGHHAETATAMGFCIFGNVAIAARHALEAHGLERVAVVDFDVHHGNGTQDILWAEPRTLFATSQQMPLWPGTGAASERGAHDNVINMPLPPGSDGNRARAEWDKALIRIAAFKPQLIVISAGFDAHRDDPLAQLQWDDDDFGALSDAICAVAARCAAPVVSCLEGGYNLDALGRSVRAHVQSLMRANP